MGCDCGCGCGGVVGGGVAVVRVVGVVVVRYNARARSESLLLRDERRDVIAMCRVNADVVAGIDVTNRVRVGIDTVPA